jgi:hypothetical protein
VQIRLLGHFALSQANGVDKVRMLENARHADRLSQLVANRNDTIAVARSLPDGTQSRALVLSPDRKLPFPTESFVAVLFPGSVYNPRQDQFSGANRTRHPARSKEAKTMSVNIKNGTPPYGESLCQTCLHAHIERGYRESEELILCQATYPDHRVRFPVRHCSAYTERKRQTLKAMEGIAWVLREHGPTRKLGFVPAKESGKPDQIEIVLGENK